MLLCHVGDRYLHLLWSVRRTLARFVGKIMLILQALEELPCNSLVDNWAEVIGESRNPPSCDTP